MFFINQNPSDVAQTNQKPPKRNHQHHRSPKPDPRTDRPTLGPGVRHGHPEGTASFELSTPPGER